MIYQIRYRITGRPASKELIREARQAFIDDKPMPAGVRVDPMAWTGTLDQLRAALKAKRAYIGEAGIVKQYAAPGVTMCDYDSPRRAPLHVIVRLARMLEAKPLWIREDKTKHGWHMLIQWNREFTPAESIAIQCVLGSDIQRETYNLARAMTFKYGDFQNERWNLLFERKL